jgi:hypothetical protein
VSETRPERPDSPHRAGAFDIRSFIAALIGVYGIVLVLMGWFSTSSADDAKTGDLNINLWAGLGMVVAAVLFQAWAMWRPVVVPADPEQESDSAVG